MQWRHLLNVDLMLVFMEARILYIWHPLLISSYLTPCLEDLILIMPCQDLLSVYQCSQCNIWWFMFVLLTIKKRKEIDFHNFYDNNNNNNNPTTGWDINTVKLLLTKAWSKIDLVNQLSSKYGSALEDLTGSTHHLVKGFVDKLV